MLPRAGAPAAGPSGRGGGSRSRAMSSTGTATVRSSAFVRPASTTVTGRGLPASSYPPRNRAASSMGRTVAESPTLWSPAPQSSSSLSSDTARCAPRLFPTSACTSSTITCRTDRSLSLARLVSMRYSDSGVVIRMSAGTLRNAARSRAGVSPVRIETDGS
jgi:hypothetical protein